MWWSNEVVESVGVKRWRKEEGERGRGKMWRMDHLEF